LSAWAVTGFFAEQASGAHGDRHELLAVLEFVRW
jgi:hypothetical protein